MPPNETSRIVIIGAGIVGTNLADELITLHHPPSLITVIEQGPLSNPGGSTSHAPGLVFQTNASKTMSRFAQYTVDKLKSLRDEGRPQEGGCFNQVGGLEIATTEERMRELRRKHGYASSWGIEAKLVTVEECLALYPHLNKSLILGGLHIPSDGLALAARAVQLLIQRTRKAGVRYLESCPVTTIQKLNHKITGVQTHQGFIAADIVISCAGFWGVEIGKMVGISIPLCPMGHQYAKTTSVPAQKAANMAPNGARLPILRYQDQDLYYREHGDRYGIGFYGHKPLPLSASSLFPTPKHVTDANMPSRLAFTPSDFTPAWDLSRQILPMLQESTLSSEGCFNGIMSFTPDAGPLLGTHPSLDGFYVAEAVWVTHSAGVARALAQILTLGKSEIDVAECELTRFEGVQLTEEYVTATASQQFNEVYDILHPYEQKQQPRNLRVSPFYTRQQALGAIFGETRGWERPEWYSINEKLLKDLPERWKPVERDVWSARNYAPVVAVEAWKTRTAVGMFDMTSQMRVRISGLGSLALLQSLTTSDISKDVGSVTHTLMLDSNGGIRTDALIARLDSDIFQVEITSPIDLAHLTHLAKSHSSSTNAHVQVLDITGTTCSINLSGPSSTTLLQSLPHTLSLSATHNTVQEGFLAGVPVTAFQHSYVSSTGWLITTTADHGLRLWDVLSSAGEGFGLVAAGRAAFFALRMEMGYRFVGTDVGSEHSPLEAGLQHLVDPTKRGYVGFEALAKLAKQKVTKRSRCLVIEDGKSMVMGKEPVFVGEKVVGYVTSAAFGYTIRKPIAFAWVDSSIKEGDKVEIEYFGDKIKAAVVSEPLLARCDGGKRRESKL